MRINGKKYTLSKFSWLIIGIVGTIILVIIIFLIFFRIPKADRIKDYLTCNMHYTETVIESDVTKTIKIGLNYEDKMINNNITDIYYFKRKDEYMKMKNIFDSENISKTEEKTSPIYSFDNKNLTISSNVTLDKSSSTYKKLPKTKDKLKEYYENEGMTCN